MDLWRSLHKARVVATCRTYHPLVWK